MAGLWKKLTGGTAEEKPAPAKPAPSGPRAPGGYGGRARPSEPPADRGPTNTSGPASSGRIAPAGPRGSTPGSPSASRLAATGSPSSEQLGALSGSGRIRTSPPGMVPDLDGEPLDGAKLTDSVFHIDLAKMAAQGIPSSEVARGDSRWRILLGIGSPEKAPVSHVEDDYPYTREEMEALIESGPVEKALAAANRIMGECRINGQLRDALEIYVRLHRAFPEAVPEAEEAAALFLYAMTAKRLPIADMALRHLIHQEPGHSLVDKRIPDMIRLCIEQLKPDLARFWMREFIRRTGNEAEVEALWASISRAEMALLHQQREREAEEARKKAEEARLRDPVTLLYDGDLVLSANALEELGQPASMTSIDMIRLVEGLSKAKNYKEAYNTALKVPRWFPDTPEAPQALFVAGWIAFHVAKNGEKALNLLEQIPRFYASSRFAERAEGLIAKVRESLPPPA